MKPKTIKLWYLILTIINNKIEEDKSKWYQDYAIHFNIQTDFSLHLWAGLYHSGQRVRNHSNSNHILIQGCQYTTPIHILTLALPSVSINLSKPMPISSINQITLHRHLRILSKIKQILRRWSKRPKQFVEESLRFANTVKRTSSMFANSIWGYR